MKIRATAANDEILKLLQSCELLISDISLSNSFQFFAGYNNQKLAGVVALECLGSVALLRSLAVPEESRGMGYGSELVIYAELQATAMRIDSLYLLTDTATALFETLGYQLSSRQSAPSIIKNTAQFSTLCSLNATFMTKNL